jgi:hypothetical protein
VPALQRSGEYPYSRAKEDAREHEPKPRDAGYNENWNDVEKGEAESDTYHIFGDSDGADQGKKKEDSRRLILPIDEPKNIT